MFTFTIRREGISDLLKSEGVQDDLDKRASRVQSTAQAIVGSRGVVTAKANPTPNRARTEISSPLYVESIDRPLGIALDAARGDE